MEKTKKSVEWQKVHIFISSTFNDMHAERDYLVKKVFPKLQDWCEKRKIRMVDIDLRWGVSETDTMNKKVVSTCLRNIDKCRPFFICLLGQRRGWVPKRDDISDDTFKDFPEIKNYADNASVTEMEILHALIDPLHKTRSCLQEESGEYYDPVKHAFFYLRDPSYLDFLPSTPDLLRKAYTNELDELIEDISRQTADNELKTWREKKIPATNRPVRNYNVKWNSEAQTPELRTPLTSSSDEPKSKVSAKWRRLWKLAGIDLEDRDISIPEGLREKAEKFNTTFTKGRLGEFKAENKELSDIIFSDLTEAIRERFYDHIDIVEAESVDETDLQKEIDQQEQFVALNSVGFIQRTGDFDQLDAYAADNSQKLFVLTAPAGMGKSMFLAKWVDRYRTKVNSESNESIHFRFIGQSDKSTSFYNIWYSLLEEIKEHTGKLEDEIIKDEQGNEDRLEAIPTDPVELHNLLYDILRKIGTRGKTIIVLDALNQLETGLKDLNWLQSELPEGINMIVSFKRGTEDTDAEKLYGILKDSAVISEIKPFESTDDRKKLIDEYLMQYLKELDQKHIDALLEIEASKNPLFLKIVLNELRIFGAFLNIKDKIRNDFGNDPLSAFEGVLKRLENDPAYSSIPPKISVPLIFGLLANSRYGLSADELVHMLLDTLGYERKDENLNQIKETVYLNLRQIRPYLARKEGRYDFFYESFKIAAHNRYVNENSDYQTNELEQQTMRHDFTSQILTLKTKDWHKIIADYFYNLPLWVQKNSNDGGQSQEQDNSREADYNDDPNKRKVSELPYHLTMAEDWNKVEETLCDLWFVEAKVRAIMTYDLARDFEDAISGFSGVSGTARETSAIESLARYARELLFYAEAHTHARLTSTVCKLPLPQHDSVDFGGTGGSPCDVTPKLKQILVFEQFVRGSTAVLDEHRMLPGFCVQHAYNSMNAGAVACAAEQILRGPSFSWPALLRAEVSRWPYEERPALLRTLHAHSNVSSLSLTPDGRYIVSGGQDGTLRIWEVRTGVALKTVPMTSRYYHVDGLAVSVDVRIAVTAPDTSDKVLRVWDLRDGAETRISPLVGHERGINSITMTPDGSLLASGSSDKTVRIWDLADGKCIQTLDAGEEIRGVHISPDGCLITALADKSAIVWETATGRIVSRVTFGSEYHCLAVSLDGLMGILAGGKNVAVWDVEGETVAPLSGSDDREYVNAVAITPNGVVGAYGTNDRILRLFDVRTREERHSYRAHSQRVTALALRTDGQFAVSGGADGTIRLWDTSRESTPPIDPELKGKVRSLAIDRPDKVALCQREDGKVRYYMLDSGQDITFFDTPGLAIGADARFCFSRLGDAVQGWDMRTGRKYTFVTDEIPKNADSKYPILSLSTLRIAAAAPRAISAGADRIWIWDLLQGVCTSGLPVPGELRALAVSDDGRFVAGAGGQNMRGSDREIRVWDLIDGHLLHTIAQEDSINALTFTPDCRGLVAGGDEGILHLWHVASGRLVQTIGGKRSWVTEDKNLGNIGGIVVTQDGRKALVVDSETLRICDLREATAGPPLRHTTRHSEIRAVALITEDARFAITGVGDRILRLWEVASGRCILITAEQADIVQLNAMSDNIVVVDIDGNALFATLRNLARGPAILTASSSMVGRVQCAARMSPRPRSPGKRSDGMRATRLRAALVALLWICLPTPGAIRGWTPHVVRAVRHCVLIRSTHQAVRNRTKDGGSGRY